MQPISDTVKMSASGWVAKEGASEVWKHFERGTGGNEGKARCKKCFKIFEKSVTTTLRYHAESKHNLVVEKMTVGGKKEPDKNQPTIDSFKDKGKDSPGLALSRLAAIDRIPFKTIADSKYIIPGLKAMGLKVPVTRQYIQRAVMDYANEMQENLKKIIAQRLSNGERFSISFDEYTSITNKRYLCLNLHGEKHDVISLGMIGIAGSLPAEEALKLIDARLALYGLNRKRHILGATTDGASMMKKLVRLMEIEHQLCHAHGTHLAVCDLIYKKTNVEPTINEDDEVCDSDNEDIDSAAAGPSNDSINNEENVELENEDDGGSLVEDVDFQAPTLEGDLKPVVKKVRKITKLFRQSPVKNAILQGYIKEWNPTKQELQLILDILTRWGSLLNMNRRFLKVVKCILKALVDLGLQHLMPTEDEIELLQGLVDILETIELGSLEMSKMDVDLLHSDKVIEFMVKSVEESTSPFAAKMAEILNIRLLERRNSSISGLLRLLSSPSPAESSLDYPTKNELLKKARDLYVRLFWSPPSATNENEEQLPQNEEEDEPKEKKSKMDELKSFLAEKQDKVGKEKLSSQADILAEVKREMTIFENTGERPAILEKVFCAIKTLPPTSVEAERAFSAAGMFVKN